MVSLCSSRLKRPLLAFALSLIVAFSCRNSGEKGAESPQTAKDESPSPVEERARESGGGPQGSTASAPQKADQGTSSPSRKSELAEKVASGADPSASMPSTRSPELRRSFSQPPQTFQIPEDEKRTLVCKGGTRLHIPSGSLEKANGEKIHAQHIKVEVKERLSNASMLKADLGTRSGEKLLRTKGMLQVRAKADGVPCRIKDGRSIGVSFTDPAWESGMKLFTGDRGPLGKMNWELEDTASKVRKPAYRPVTNDRFPRLKGGNMNLKIFLLKNGEYPMKAVRKGIEGKVLAKVTVTKRGKLENIEITESPSPILTRAAKRTLKNSDRWYPARLGKENVELRFTIPIRYSLGEKDRHRKVFLAEGYAPDRSLSRRARDVSIRMYRTQKLGWINCDAFRNDAELITQKVHLDRKDIGLRLLFKEQRSLLRSHRSERDPTLHLLKNVPKGKKVHLIAIGKQGDRFRWASVEMTIGQDPPELEYETLSKGEMEERMRALNEGSGRPS